MTHHLEYHDIRIQISNTGDAKTDGDEDAFHNSSLPPLPQAAQTLLRSGKKNVKKNAKKITYKKNGEETYVTGDEIRTIHSNEREVA